jgi:hypothetical protein
MITSFERMRRGRRMNEGSAVMSLVRRTFPLALIAFTAVLPAWGQQPDEIRATVAVSDVPGGQPGDVFEALQFLDLHFDVTLAGELEGEHILELAAYTPNGHLYQVLTTPISTAPDRAGLPIRVVGYPDPLPTQHLQAERPGEDLASSATFRLPVAGTAIISNSLYGRWTIRLRLDHQWIICDQPCTFLLEPPTPTLLFKDGFESGDLTAWTGG